MAGQIISGSLSRAAALLMASSALFSPQQSLAQIVSAAPVQPLYGNLRPYFGDIGPDYGHVRPFYGALGPFYGNLRPFFGVIDPDYGKLRPDSAGSIWTAANPYAATVATGGASNLPTGTDAFWGSGAANPFARNPSKYIAFTSLAGYWATAGQNWSTVMSDWAKASTSSDFTSLGLKIQSLILTPSSSFWQKAVAAGPPVVGLAVAPRDTPAPTSFVSLAARIFDAYGIKIDASGAVAPSSLVGVSQTDQASAFLSFYDALMSYSGAPHVDWWMAATGWSPYLAQTATDNSERRRPVTVGLIDMSATSTGQSLPKGSLYQYGSSVFDNGHGAAVSSIIVGSFDGSGVLGVLPSKFANVAVYNPYDSSGTTNWTEIGKAVDSLSALTFGTEDGNAPVGVLNASLGVAGSTLDQGWNTALASGSAHGHLLVLAAGNDGAVQSANVQWNFAANPSLLIVGSVGLDGKISNFSNQPGEACLIDTVSGACDKLKNHFIVAPGELILVSDGHGGVTRQSGTSLAAPLVSGAAILLQARWPWLAWHPNAIADILLRSATPLGVSPGHDAVYGAGELNIAASQSPLNWNAVQYFTVDAKHPQVGKGDGTAISASQLISTLNSGSQAVWNASKLYITAVETIDDTARDFKIPLASTLVGQRVADHAGLPVFQSFLTDSLLQWARTTTLASGLVDAPSSSAQSASRDYGQIAGFSARLSMAPTKPVFGFKADRAPYATDISLQGSRSAIRIGYGENPAALGLTNAFASTDGFDQGRSVSEPYMRLASGGAYAAVHVSPLAGVVVTASATEIRRVRDEALFGPRVRVSGAANYQARAESVGVAYDLSPAATVRMTITQLQEANGLLGIQAIAPDLLTGGSTTEAVSLEAHADLSGGFTAHATLSTGRTHTAQAQALRTNGAGLTSTSAAISLVKSDLLTTGDALKLTLSEPMHVSSGGVTLFNYGVTNRETGTLGVISESQSLKMSETPVAVELNYGRSLGRHSEAGAFFRYENQSPTPGQSLTASTVFGIKAQTRF